VPGELADKIRGAGVVRGKRKQATVVFADLSGFTALSERLDPEDVRAQCLQN
jgi:class 3 adenylate cyclase